MNNTVFDFFTHSVDCGLIVTDRNFNITYINKWIQTHTNFQSTTPKHLEDIVHHDIKELLYEEITKCFEQNVQIELDHEKFPFIIKCKLSLKASHFFQNMQQTIKLFPNKQTENILIHIADVTNHKELTKKLQATLHEQQHLNYLVSYDNELLDQNILMVKTTTDGIVTDASKAFLQFTGSREDDFIGYKQFFLSQKEWDELENNPKYKCNTMYKIKQKTFFAEVSMIPTYNPHEQSILEYTILLHDLTDKKTIEVLKSVDGLTNIMNRIRFQELFEYEFNQSKRYKSQMSLLSINIDNFISINDKYGFTIGNEILFQFAEVLKKNIRKTDTIARWDGDEFMILLTKTDLQGAVIATEIIKNLIQHSSFEQTYITCSYGVSTLDPNDNIDDIYIRVEKAIKDAKQKGGNTIVAI